MQSCSLCIFVALMCQCCCFPWFLVWMGFEKCMQYWILLLKYSVLHIHHVQLLLSSSCGSQTSWRNFYHYLCCCSILFINLLKNCPKLISSVWQMQCTFIWTFTCNRQYNKFNSFNVPAFGQLLHLLNIILDFTLSVSTPECFRVFTLWQTLDCLNLLQKGPTCTLV